MTNTDTLNNSREALAHDAENLSRDVNDAVQHVKDHAKAHVDNLKNRANDSFDLVRSCVTQRPLATLATVFAVGYVTALWRNR